jgi:hypothetical protein
MAYEKFEGTKSVIGRLKSKKDIQYNDMIYFYIFNMDKTMEAIRGYSLPVFSGSC